MLLHTFNKTRTYHDNLCFVGTEDHVVLMEDAVYALTESEDLCGDVYFVKADVESRGLASKVNATSKLIDYDDFVGMCVAADHIKNWF